MQGIGFFIKDRPNPDAPRQGAAQVNNNIQLLNTGGDVEYTDETYMVLGLQLNNPYSIPNMTAAYNAFFNWQLTTVPVTHKYVRFAPANEAQIAMLDDSLELDLYIHPLDHEMLQDGDLYVHAGSTIEDIPYLYTVVPANYNLPSSVAHTVLSDLHLPEGEAGLYLEELAESMALGAQYSSYTQLQPGQTLTVVTREDVTLGNGEHPTYEHLYADCFSPENFTLCPDDPGYGPPPPPPTLVCGLPALTATNPGYPGGRIRVLDTQLGICEPVADVKIRTKNWFKIRNTRTNTDGTFLVGTQYRNRVKINVIFRNDEVSVRPLRNKAGIRLSLFPITYTVGVYTSWHAMNTVDKVFERPNNRLSKGFEAWLACNAINSRKEQIAFAESPAEGLKAMKASDHRVNLYLVKHGLSFYDGPQAELLMQHYLYRNKVFLDYLIDGVKIATYFASKDYVGVINTVMNAVLGSQRPDIMYSYNTHPDNPSRALENLSSNEIKQKFYDVYTQLGLLKATEDKVVKWKNFFKVGSKYIDAGAGHLGAGVKTALKELAGMNKSGNTGSATSFALTVLTNVVYSINIPDRQYFEQVKGFSNYYGHYMCHLRYGMLSDPIIDHKSNTILNQGGLSAHAVLLENWQPNVAVDEKRYHRLGLFYDLVDNAVDEVQTENLQNLWRNDLMDGVSNKAMFYGIAGGYTVNLQWAFPTSWNQFRDNILHQYPNRTNNINTLMIPYLIQ